VEILSNDDDGSTVRATMAEPVPLALVTVIVTEKFPREAGAPEITPVAPSIVNPGGKPTAA
jgi:hypothetical protein